VWTSRGGCRRGCVNRAWACEPTVPVGDMPPKGRRTVLLSLCAGELAATTLPHRHAWVTEMGATTMTTHDDPEST